MILYIDNAVIEIYNPIDYIKVQPMQALKRLVKIARASDTAHDTNGIETLQNALQTITARTAKERAKFDRLTAILWEGETMKKQKQYEAIVTVKNGYNDTTTELTVWRGCCTKAQAQQSIDHFKKQYEHTLVKVIAEKIREVKT